MKSYSLAAIQREERFADHFRRSQGGLNAARYVIRVKYAFPGGYPIVLVVDDGETLCADCVATNFREIRSAAKDKRNDGWRPCFCTVYEQDEEPEYCGHCGKDLSE